MEIINVDSAEKEQQFKTFLAEQSPLVLDCESTGLAVRKDKVISYQVGTVNCDTVWYGEATRLALLSAVPRSTVLIGHGFKFDLKILHAHGIDLTQHEWHDTLHMHHLIDENLDHDLDSIVKEKWNDPYKEEFWAKYKAFGDAPPDEGRRYSCKDVLYTGKLYQNLYSQLVGREQLSIFRLVSNLAQVLVRSEIRGIGVDLLYLSKIDAELQVSLEETRRALRALGDSHCDSLEYKYWERAINKLQEAHPKGKKWQTIPKPAFNFSSSAQVRDLLYGELSLPVQRNDKTKQPSTDDKALSILAPLSPIAEKLQVLRTYEKMYSAFVEGLYDKIENGHIYPSYNPSGTGTGRLSHSGPNMAQLPSDDTWSKLRGVYVPGPGRKLLTCDYDSLEVRVAAHFSQDRNLLTIIYDGASKHDITAQSLGIPRPKAKTLNFALQYRCSHWKVAQILGVSAKEGLYYYNKYWETYAGEDRVFQECCAKVDRGEPISSPWGRRAHFPTEFSNKGSKSAAYRQAYSALIQGTGSDLTSWSLVQVDTAWTRNAWGDVWFSVHDELLGECLESFVPDAREVLINSMESAGKQINFSVPLVAKCSGGLDRWEK